MSWEKEDFGYPLVHRSSYTPEHIVSTRVVESQHIMMNNNMREAL